MKKQRRIVFVIQKVIETHRTHTMRLFFCILFVLVKMQNTTISTICLLIQCPKSVHTVPRTLKNYASWNAINGKFNIQKMRPRAVIFYCVYEICVNQPNPRHLRSYIKPRRESLYNSEKMRRLSCS